MIKLIRTKNAGVDVYSGVQEIATVISDSGQDNNMHMNIATRMRDRREMKMQRTAALRIKKILCEGAG